MIGLLSASLQAFCAAAASAAAINVTVGIVSAVFVTPSPLMSAAT